jgi:hypothetical protein
VQGDFMKLLAIIIMVLSTQYTYALNIGFGHGSTIKTDEVEGYVSVHCRGGDNNSWNNYSCYSNDLVGGDYGKVVVNNGTIDADWVKLQREGSKYVKGSKFNALTGETRKNFNLWIRTLLQRPLLEKGENKIIYTFTKNKKIVKTGSFIVTVIEGEFRQCRNGSSTYYGNCPSSYSACDDYFQRHNYCQ